MLLWAITLGRPCRLDSVPPQLSGVVEEIAAEGRGVVRDGRLHPGRHPRADRFTDEAAAAITAGMRLIASALTEDGPVRADSWAARAAAAGIDPAHLQEGYAWLREDGLVATKGGVTAAVGDTSWAVPARPAVQPVQPVQEPAVRSVHRSEPAVQPVHRTEPAVQPVHPAEPGGEQSLHPAEPGGERPEPHSLYPPPAPGRSRRTGPAHPQLHGSVVEELLQRLVVATEATTTLAVAGAGRVRTPLGISPLLDTQRRIAEVIVAYGPMNRRELAINHLTRQGRKYRNLAIAEGVRMGAFAVMGIGRWRRVELIDPAPLGVSWDELKKAAEAILRRRAERELKAAKQLDSMLDYPSNNIQHSHDGSGE